MTKHKNKFNTCGFDFGTSNTNVSIIDENGEIQCHSFPSAIFFELETRETYFGQEALDIYLSQSDYEENSGRLLTSFKSLLGTSTYDMTTIVHGVQTDFASIIASYIAFVKAEVEARTGRTFTRAISGRPVFFVDEKPDADQKAQDDLEILYRRCGFEHIEFVPEPVAATKSFLNTLTDKHVTLLTVDIGGGTSDFCLFKPTQQSRLDTVGVHIGGDDFDMHFGMQSTMPLLGLKSTFRDKPDLSIPNSYFYDLCGWRTISSLYNYQTINQIKQLALKVTDRTALDRMLTVLTERQGHFVLKQVQNTKITLSENEQATIDLDFIEANLVKTVTIHDLTQALSPSMDKLDRFISKILSETNTPPDSIDYVMCTGGSTLSPVMYDMLRKRFPAEKIIRHDPFDAVAKGLILSA